MEISPYTVSMRVVAGYLGGRVFESPHSHNVHPMSDKMRGALFNALGDINGLTVLDAFAGSGAMSIEAISRGAKHATAIDIDNDAFKTIQRNVGALGIENQITVLRKNARGWASNNQDRKFDLVLADPPYDNIDPSVLTKIITLVKDGGLFVLSWPGKEPVRAFEGLTQLQANSYGDSQLVFYRKA